VDKPGFVHKISGLRSAQASGLRLYGQHGLTGQYFDLQQNRAFPTFGPCGYADAYPQRMSHRWARKHAHFCNTLPSSGKLA
jgi:hypothetical protein